MYFYLSLIPALRYVEVWPAIHQWCALQLQNETLSLSSQVLRPIFSVVVAASGYYTIAPPSADLFLAWHVTDLRDRRFWVEQSPLFQNRQQHHAVNSFLYIDNPLIFVSLPLEHSWHAASLFSLISIDLSRAGSKAKLQSRLV